MPGSSSPWRLNFVRRSLTYVAFSLEPSSCHLLAARILRRLVGCFRKSVHPCLVATALQFLTKFAAAACAQNLPYVIPIHIALFTPNLRVLWKDFSISPANSISVDKKNHFSSNSCSTCFGQPCAHHQELTTAWCYSLVLVCAVAAGRWSSPVGR